MITKEQYEMAKIEVDSRLARVRILMEEQDLFVIENCFKPEMEEAVEDACKYYRELKKMETDLLDVLYDLYYKYNIQFAKPVPSKPYHK